MAKRTKKRDLFVEVSEGMSALKKEQPVEIGLKVMHEGFSEETSEVDPDDRWSRASTSTSWSVDGIALEKEYPDVTACFPVVKGDGVYLVYVVYSTGDTFGHDENSTIVFVDLFLDEKKADVAASTIREHSDAGSRLSEYRLTAKERQRLVGKYKDRFSVDIVRENGKTMSVHAGWNGYFESLSYVEVAHFVVDTNKRKRY